MSGKRTDWKTPFAVVSWVRPSEESTWSARERRVRWRETKASWRMVRQGLEHWLARALNIWCQ